MTKKAEYAIRPHRVNVGGVFIAALKGALQPLSAAVLVPLFLLAPALGAAIYYHVFSKQDLKICSFKKGFLRSTDFKSVLLGELLYLVSLYAVVKAAVYKIQEYFEIYKEKALENKVLQLGTPEQLEYAQNTKQIIYLGAAAVFIVMVLVITNTMIKCFQKDRATINTSSFKDAFAATGLNAVSYALLFVLSGFLFSVLEVYFARYKLMYLQGYILGTDAFDPSVIFLILRIYLLHICFFAVSLTAYASIGLKEKICLRTDSRH